MKAIWQRWFTIWAWHWKRTPPAAKSGASATDVSPSVTLCWPNTGRWTISANTWSCANRNWPDCPKPNPSSPPPLPPPSSHPLNENYFLVFLFCIDFFNTWRNDTQKKLDKDKCRQTNKKEKTREKIWKNLKNSLNWRNNLLFFFNFNSILQVVKAYSGLATLFYLWRIARTVWKRVQFNDLLHGKFTAAGRPVGSGRTTVLVVVSFQSDNGVDVLGNGRRIPQLDENGLGFGQRFIQVDVKSQIVDVLSRIFSKKMKKKCGKNVWNCFIYFEDFGESESIF